MLTNIYDVDALILSYVEDLNNIPKNEYFDNILNDQNFWKIRLHHEYTHINTIDYKSVVQLLDENFYSLDDVYFLSTPEISEQLCNIFKYNNPIYLLTPINIQIDYLMNYKGQSYINFTNTIIECYDAGGFLMNDVISDKLTYNRNNINRLKNYFNEIIYIKDTISIRVNTHLGYQIIELYHKGGFTNGELLYEFAKGLPLGVILNTKRTYIFFDGLYYDNGIYNLLTYTNQLINTI